MKQNMKVSFFYAFGILSVFLPIIQTKVVNAPSNEDFKFFILSEKCYQMLTENYTLDLPCFKLTLSKAIGLALVTFSIILKVPQILKMTSSKSSEGLSYFGFFVELLSYTFSFGYNLHYKNPFSTYGENVFLMVQVIIITFLIKLYSKNFSSLLFYFSQLIYLGFCVVLFLDLVPEEVHYFSLLINIAFVYCSRIPQISLNFSNKSTGQLSFITTFLSFGGCVARIFTLLVEVNDMLLMALMVSATVLNGILIAQFLLYWRNSKKKKVQ